VNFDVESEGSPTAFTEFTGRDMICGAGLCSMQGSVVQHGVTRGGHSLCVHIVIYSYILVGVQGTVSSIRSATALNSPTQSDPRCTVVRNVWG